jgi:hypothetical protein
LALSLRKTRHRVPVPRLSGVGLWWCPGRGPGMETRVMEGAELARLDAGPRRTEAPSPAARPSPGRPRRPGVRLSVRDRGGTVRLLQSPNPSPGPGQPREAGRTDTFSSLGLGLRWPHARLPASPSAPAGRLEAAPLPAGLGREDGRLPGDGGGTVGGRRPGSAASCRGGGGRGPWP